MRRAARLIPIVLLLTIAAAPPVLAVFSGDMSPRARSSDEDYANGIEAFDAKDWPAVVEHMSKVVARRPHHDNAWARLGFALRKLKRYDESLVAYGKSIELNGGNRSALEYLGEAYLELDRLADAEGLLARLEVECRKVVVSFSDGNFTSGCNEYVQLARSIVAYREARSLPAAARPGASAGSNAEGPTAGSAAQGTSVGAPAQGRSQ